MLFFKAKSMMVAAAIAACFSLSAHAELSSVDWQEQGDGGITFDSQSGLEWLDLTYTLDMSLNDVSAELGQGGMFEGWRLPSPDEVQGLMERMYPEVVFYDDKETFESELIENSPVDIEAHAQNLSRWNSLLGVVVLDVEANNSQSSSGLGFYFNDEEHNEAFDGIDVFIAGVQKVTTKTDGDTESTVRDYQFSWVNDYSASGNYTEGLSSPIAGVFVVSDDEMSNFAMAVPAKGAFVASLMLAGLFAGTRKKKK